ncbi:hypothetical protein L6452_16930 [Arctium lappa]|uniref:Uncharacterized protein n=1 Tax=Arctium lappa TaxID=4217 RepID=A0ACB9C1V8_ARCLA|nr:hypothetical protein L6452_16930 [Arctium lappa]
MSQHRCRQSSQLAHPKFHLKIIDHPLLLFFSLCQTVSILKIEKNKKKRGWGLDTDQYQTQNEGMGFMFYIERSRRVGATGVRGEGVVLFIEVLQHSRDRSVGHAHVFLVDELMSCEGLVGNSRQRDVHRFLCFIRRRV